MHVQLTDSEVSYYNYIYLLCYLAGGGLAVSDVDSAYTSCACDVNLEQLASAAACGALRPTESVNNWFVGILHDATSA